MEQAKEDNTTQHQRDVEAYERWLEKDPCACLTLSSMYDDIIQEFNHYPTAR